MLDLETVLGRYFEADGRSLTFRYAPNMAHVIKVQEDHVAHVVEAAVRHLAKAAYEAGRRRGRVDVLETMTLGEGPYR